MARLVDVGAQVKAGQALASNDWLMSIRSRIGIPGGTCEFDLPAYFAWQHFDAATRQQDLQRRELVANISHDLRTPLSSLHGYLETLALKDATLSPDERRRYLGIALAQRSLGGGGGGACKQMVKVPAPATVVRTRRM